MKDVQSSRAWGYNGYNWNSNYYGYNYLDGSQPTLNTFKDSRGYYTIPIIDSYTGIGYAGTLLTDARNLIMRRGQVQLNLAQVLIQMKRIDRARQTLQDLREETFGTYLERQANGILRSLG